MRRKGLHIAFYLHLLLMGLPVLQMTFHLFKEKPLNGAFTLADKPVLSKESWMNGSFQSGVEKYLKDHAGFRNFLVRLQNQIDFTFFKEAHAEGVVIGKQRQLYEYDYIRAWLAEDYPGDSFVEKKLLRLKYVQEYLKKEKGIDLVLVFEPGKASYYPEFIPEKYTSEKDGLSTYGLYRKKADELGVDFIDFNQYFLDLKQESAYPLFPRSGTHWSLYGMQFAADSLLNFIEKRKGIQLTGVRADTLETSQIPKDTDDDVLKTMNTLFGNRSETLAYPKFTFDTIHPGKKPMVLVVADSYYWNIFNSRIPKYVFANEAFWYFNSRVYPDYYYEPKYTKDLDFQKETEKQDLIFLMVTERFVHKFDWRFIDQLYDLYTPDWLSDAVYDKINSVMAVETWYNEIIIKSQAKQIALDKALLEEGKYLYYKSDTSGFLIDFGMEHFKRLIDQDSAWSAHVRQQAVKENFSYEKMLLSNAEYVFQNEYPVLFEISRGMTRNREKLLSSPDLLAALKEEAAVNYWDTERYLRKKSWDMFKEDELLRSRQAILGDPKWLNDVKAKANRNGISVDSMILLDARYMFDKKYNSFNLEH